MTYAFAFTPGADDTEFRLVGPAGPVPVDAWALEAPAPLLAGLDLLQRLEAADVAVSADQAMLIENATVAGLSAREAALLGLPPLAPAVAHVRTRGLIARPDFGADLEWRRPTGQPIAGAQRVGAFLRIGDAWGRLPDALFAIARAVDALNAAGADDGARYKALADLREALPPAEESGAAQASGLASSMTIAVADAFSLGLEGEGEEARLIPVLHRAGGAPDETLLPEGIQREFATKHFNAFGSARPVYAVGGGTYVVLAAPVRRALDVVRRTQAKPLSAKRALLAAPRAVLRQALGDEVDDAVLETVFRETAAYSERVVGLGLWQKRVLPWIALEAQDWFDGGAPGGRGGGGGPRANGLIIDDQCIPLSPEEADALRGRVEAAIGAGEPVVPFMAGEERVEVPASHATLAALQALELERARAKPGPHPDGEEGGAQKSAPEVLVISTNEEKIEVEGAFQARPVPEAAHPACLATKLKSHQEEGLAWLRESYAAGRPGVLLADDMGLGKTLQGLAFLAWLREGMEAGRIPRAPVAVVAPTGLLQNWKAEAERHLSQPGLGRCLEAFGNGLAALKRQGPGDRPGLDGEAAP